IFEELLFRGTILRGLLKYRFFKQKLCLISYANIATSILFVFYHLIFHPIIWALLTFFPSLIFGFIMEKRELVIYPIFIHIFYNFSYLYL
ncbi:MAG: JDVT-CTERM system CAAX-type protease, partial [Epsilonproteobacteria bacterium]|nr:JDVT-CTERM system CAAX-type protease [Campylobacterota bacterium]